MCNEYAREVEAGRVISAMKEMADVPPFSWMEGRIPNDIAPTAHVKIRDRGLIVKLKDEKLVGDMMTWAWPGPRGKPVFNFVSEKRDFRNSDRCLIIATGFYEYTAPQAPKIKLRDQHLFTMKGEEWFWIAGIVKENCFTMLTTAPGPDVQPYHDRQICTLKPEQGIDWLRLSLPQNELLRTPPKGQLKVTTLRRNGVAVAAIA
jgi:putative SOS response-associated peptidase YedK